MPYDSNNVFAKILRGEIPCAKVLETAHSLAFNDISPIAPVHVLIIPKGAYEDFSAFTAHSSAEETLDFYGAIRSVIEKLKPSEGYRIITNSGRNGGQEVPHYHAHLLAGESLGPMLAK